LGAFVKIPRYPFVSDKPSPPTGPAAVEWKSDDSLQLRWNVPESDGGSAITQYIVERREVGKKSWKQVIK
jgi:titin